MKAKSCTSSFTVDRSPDVAYAAINNVPAWWSGNHEGSTDTLGGMFTHCYEDMHRCKIEVVELVPNQKVVWLIVDNYFGFTKDKAEWKGTDIVFEIVRKGDKTEVKFTHVGLIPEYECYDVCSDAWSGLLNGTLRGLIADGSTPAHR